MSHPIETLAPLLPQSPKGVGAVPIVANGNSGVIVVRIMLVTILITSIIILKTCINRNSFDLRAHG